MGDTQKTAAERMPDADFTAASKEIRMLARFHGEEEDPAVQAFLVEVDRSRKGEAKALDLLEEFLTMRRPDLYPEPWIEEIRKFLRGAGRL